MNETTTNISTAVPLNEITRPICIISHYLIFIFGAWTLWVFLEKFHSLQTRIQSPFLMLLGLTWLQISAAFEIGTHEYDGNWELTNFPPTDLINGSHDYFNFVGQAFIALSMKKYGSSIIPVCLGFVSIRDDSKKFSWLELVSLLFDMLMIGTIFGRSIAYSSQFIYPGIKMFMRFFDVITLFGTVIRLHRNIGPTKITAVCSVIYCLQIFLGIATVIVYGATGIEWLHSLSALMFILSIVPFTTALLYTDNKREEGIGSKNQTK